MRVPVLMVLHHLRVHLKTHSFSHSQSGNDNGNDNNEVIPFKHTKKYFNHESHDGYSENDTPFSLPFP
jgi:hypothetical protein